MIKNLNIDLLYQNNIDGPPLSGKQLFGQAAQGDDATITHWREIWLRHLKENKEIFKSFGDKTIGKLFGINKYKPAIVCGSGPSLKDSLEALKENSKALNPVMVISCLHNFGYFEDEGFHADYYVNLDAGDLTVKDIYESRKEKPEHYWDKTKGKTLLTITTANPELLKLWQGEIYFFNVIIPDVGVHKAIQDMERFTHNISSGGNALGGCLYIAHSIFSSHVIHFVGADFCFDYDNTFHSYKTHYDALGNYTIWPDVYGIPRKTWNSYLNFKFWFDWFVSNIPGRYVNCSSGIMGAYREGNIKQFQYMSLKDALVPYLAMDRVYLERKDALGNTVSKDMLLLKDYFNKPDFDIDMALI